MSKRIEELRNILGNTYMEMGRLPNRSDLSIEEYVEEMRKLGVSASQTWDDYDKEVIRNYEKFKENMT